MPTETYYLTPRDQLFLRDARPMDAADAGLGANWPRPDQLWNALIHSCHRQWPQHQPWEHRHSKRDHENAFSSDRFGGLKSIGPFPFALADATDQGETLFRRGLYLPCPLDLSAADDGTLHPMHLVPGEQTNLPTPLELAFASSRLGKVAPPTWLHAEDLRTYLQGNPFTPTAGARLFDKERHIGIAIDPDTHATIEGRFYQAEYLRLNDTVRIAFAASCDIIGAARQEVDVLAKLGTDFDLIMGGQQGIARVERASQPLALPDNAAHGDSLLLKWILLTPALFPAIAANAEKGIACHPGGWLPNWVDPASGQVRLPRDPGERQPGEPRHAWRQRLATAPPFAARLVAARVGKPLAFSGWRLPLDGSTADAPTSGHRQGGPKPTVLAVPAGSVYVFRCQDQDERDALARALQWNGGNGSAPCNRRSGMHGEKGFGIGICTTCNQ